MHKEGNTQTLFKIEGVVSGRKANKENTKKPAASLEEVIQF